MRDKTPAAEGGAPVRASFLPFARPSIGETEIFEVVETLKSGWLTVGPRTREFERVLADYVGVDDAAAVNSCTGGLHLSMVVLGVERDDEVVIPALNFASAANHIVHLGARPVLVDVDPETLNVTAELVERAITPRTRLVVPVHFGGRPCPMKEIVSLAHERGVKVLGDAAHAIGADCSGQKVGSMADATAFSFYVTKGITTGEGGMVTATEPGLVDKVRTLALHGMSRDAWKRYADRGPWYYEIREAGYKYNMNDIQAALGLTQMLRADEFREAREAIAHAYDVGFFDVDEVTVPAPFRQGKHAWHLYPIQIDFDALRISRDQFINHLLDEGIGVSVHFIPLHYHPFYRDRLGHTRGDFPSSEHYFARAISLPIYPSMTETDIEDVVEAVRKLIAYYKR